MNQEHLVDKVLSRHDVEVILSDHMKSLGYKAGQGWGGDIGMVFKKNYDKESVSFNSVTFHVQDPLNPEPERIYVSKKDAIAIIAKVRKLDLTKVDISLT